MEKIGDEYVKDTKQLISDFNEAKFQIFRLNMLWISCNTLSQSGDFGRWKWKLDAIWRELSPDAMEKDGYKNDYGSWIRECRAKEGTYLHKVNELNKKITLAKTRSPLYNALQDKDIFLRCLQDAVGKGSKRKDKDEDDIDG